jgi:hypothetical protein
MHVRPLKRPTKNLKIGLGKWKYLNMKFALVDNEKSKQQDIPKVFDLQLVSPGRAHTCLAAFFAQPRINGPEFLI